MTSKTWIVAGEPLDVESFDEETYNQINCLSHNQKLSLLKKELGRYVDFPDKRGASEDPYNAPIAPFKGWLYLEVGVYTICMFPIIEDKHGLGLVVEIERECFVLPNTTTVVYDSPFNHHFLMATWKDLYYKAAILWDIVEQVKDTPELFDLYFIGR